ncbi:phage tail protein [Fastidiosibacter lacustris]|uniref:phage tail protein n=1 Tax=Fastidiosibacter lacustris TaxID=2056695 RepID=UPI000E345EC4|nr:phage tail protein [Fastidiosibacter lacustris]
MAFIPLVLGKLPFSVNTATYNKISKSYSSNWATQERVNNSPALQNTGDQSETMTISGVTFPCDNLGAKGALVALRELAASQDSNFLFDLDGFIYGKWAITNIQQENTNNSNTSYSVSLSRYPETTAIDQAKAYVKNAI